jgi:cytochrome c553
MKKTVITLLAVIAFAGTAIAAGPETITLPAKNGNITFQHWKHQERLKDCKKCHAAATGGKIEGLGKDWAHNTCKKCHTDGGKGPTKCPDCHKK